MPHYWLLKSEPSCFSFDDLYRSPHHISHWDGVRNHQACGFLKAMAVGDKAFFYHSNCEDKGIVGVVDIVREAYPDFTAFDPNSEHPDLKTSPDKPRWYMVDVKWQEKLPLLIPLHALKAAVPLADMPLVKRGNRLSVMPVTAEEWQYILTMK